jgi:Cof subfamily protein (haloacid dehalogenase superfamily)
MTPPASIKLIAIDLDGTLLNSHHQLTDRTKHTLRKAIAAGIQVVIATGKTRYSAREAISELALQTPGVYLQGLMICNSDGSIRHQQPISPDVVRDVAAFARSRGLSMAAYSGGDILTEQRNTHTDRLIAYHEPVPTEIASYETALETRPMNKLLLIDTVDSCTEARQALAPLLEGRATQVQALADMLEILPPGASKGVGLRWLLDDLGIAPEQVMAIGDGENDIEMLQMVGIGVAMGNANPLAKAAADYVVASNDEDGVAEAVERFVLAPMGLLPQN